MDLTPRTSPSPGAPARRAKRSWWAGAALAALLAAGAFLLFQGLSSATTYFYNADEAVARREQLGDDRFRLQGTVVEGSVARDDARVAFEVAFNGVTVSVVHEGDPPELFQPGIPVVLEGRWDGERFASDRIMVKHTSEYKAENPDRVPAGAP